MNRARRITAIAVALAGAGLLALAVQGGRWWEITDATIGDVTIGPVSSYRCFSGDCRVAGLGWIESVGGWTRAGQATYAAGLCAAAMLVFSAAGLAAKKVIRIVAKSGLVAALTAAVSGGVFVAMFPGVSGAGLGRGFVFYALGVALAIAGQVLVLRAPVEPRPPAPGPTAA
jgi:hypothetical protein